MAPREPGQLQASDLDDLVVVRLTRRGRIVATVSALALAGAAAWGLWFPDTAPAFFSWPPAQLIIVLSAVQTMVQLTIDQGRGLIRVGPQTTSVWRVGGLPRRHPSSSVTISTEPGRASILVDDRPLSRLELFDIPGAFGRSPKG